MSLKSTKPSPDLARAEKAIAAMAAAYPEVREDAPWGHRAFKVKNKVFLFLGADAEGLGLSVKLPESGVMALELPFAEPTRYGLGKSGWVSARFAPKDAVPLDLLRDWIAESYRAIAPKKLAALVGGEPTPSTGPRPAKRQAAKKVGKAAKKAPAKRRR
jgi:predicted DNA-binding protein (MmcQ/YjbR family)